MENKMGFKCMRCRKFNSVDPFISNALHGMEQTYTCSACGQKHTFLKGKLLKNKVKT